MVMEAGTLKAELLLFKDTLIPFEGAAELILTVATELSPPRSVLGLNASSVNFGARTFSVVVALPALSEAVIVEVVSAATATVEILKVAVCLPALTFTLAPTVALLLDELMFTTCPLVPAVAAKVTVPVALDPPVREAGDTLSDWTACP